MTYQPPGLDNLRTLLACPTPPDAATWARLVSLTQGILDALDRALRACAEGLPRELLVCPKCDRPHVDGTFGAEFATRPHHTHACGHCGEPFDTKRWSFGGDRFGPSTAVSRAELLAYLAERRTLVRTRGRSAERSEELRGRLAAFEELTRHLTGPAPDEPPRTAYGRLLFVSYVDGHPADVRTVDPIDDTADEFRVSYYDFVWSRRSQCNFFHLSDGGPLRPEVVTEGDHREFWAASWVRFVDAQGFTVDPVACGLTRLDAPRGDPFEGAERAQTVECVVCHDHLPAEGMWPCAHLFWGERVGAYVGPGDAEARDAWRAVRGDLLRFVRRTGCARTLWRALADPRRPLDFAASFGEFTLGGRTFEEPPDEWRKGLGEFALEWLGALRGRSRAATRLRRWLRRALGRTVAAQARRRASGEPCYVVRTNRADPGDATRPVPWSEASAVARALRAQDGTADVWIAVRRCAKTLPPATNSTTTER